MRRGAELRIQGPQGEAQQEQALTHLRKLFEKMDSNRHGAVNRREMIAALRKSAEVRRALRLPVELRPGTPAQALLEAFFRDLEPPGSGAEVPWDEFEAAVRRPPSESARAGCSHRAFVK